MGRTGASGSGTDKNWNLLGMRDSKSSAAPMVACIPVCERKNGNL